MPSERGATGEPEGLRHLPRIALLFAFLRSLRTYALPLLAVLVFSGGDGYERWLVIFLVPSLGIALFRYFTFTYSLGREDLVIRSGLFFRQERHIPYARIQNVDLRQNPLHRLAGVAVVRLETGSGGAAEAEIEVLREDAIAELRAAVFRRGGQAGSPGEIAAAETPAAEAGPLLALGFGDLVLRGFLTGRGWLLLGAGIGLIHQFKLIDIGDQIDRLKSISFIASVFTAPLPTEAGTIAWLRSLVTPHNLLLVLVFLAVLWVATRLLSIVWTLFTFWGFRLSRRGDDLTTQQGLLTRVSATLPRHRIQALELRIGWLDGLFGRASLVAATAGRGISGERDVENPSTEQADLFLAPILRRAAAEQLMRELAPEFFDAELEWHGLAESTFFRLLKKRLLLLLPVALAAGWLLGPWILPPFAALAAYQVVATRRFVDKSRWALGRQAIFWRTGVFGEVSKMVPLEKVQVVELHSSPFDRRRGTATLQVDTAATDFAFPTLVLPYLEAAAARELAARLENETGRRSFRW